MKITVESTAKIVTLNGVPTRVWEGTTEAGVAVHCFIARVAVHGKHDCERIQKELRDSGIPSVVESTVPMRMAI